MGDGDVGRTTGRGAATGATGAGDDPSARGDGGGGSGGGGGGGAGVGAGGRTGAAARGADTAAAECAAPFPLTVKTLLQMVQRARIPAPGTFVGSTRYTV